MSTFRWDRQRHVQLPDALLSCHHCWCKAAVFLCPSGCTVSSMLVTYFTNTIKPIFEINVWRITACLCLHPSCRAPVEGAEKAASKSPRGHQARLCLADWVSEWRDDSNEVFCCMNGNGMLFVAITKTFHCVCHFIRHWEMMMWDNAETEEQFFPCWGQWSSEVTVSLPWPVWCGRRLQENSGR